MPREKKKIEGVDSYALYESIRAHGHKDAVFAEDFKSALSYLKDILKPGDILLTLGAGDVWKIGDEVRGARFEV